MPYVILNVTLTFYIMELYKPRRWASLTRDYRKGIKRV